MTEEVKPKSEEKNLLQESEQVLTDAKKEHKGRYPTAVAKKVSEAKGIKLREKKNGTIMVQDKLDLFLEEWLRNGGNATEAALVIFKSKSRYAAARIGSAYLAKGKLLGRVMMEEKGYHYGKILDMIFKRMEQDKSADFVPLLDRVLKLAEYHNFMPDKNGGNGGGTTVNVMTVQKELLDDYVTGEYVNDGEEEK